MTSADLMRAAALDAFDRLLLVKWQRDIRTLYGPLSETLVWISAFAEQMGLTQEPCLSGLMYARNCTLHGAVIVTEESIQGPWAHSPLKGALGNRFIGNTVAYVWGVMADPQPYVLGMKDTPKRRADYCEHVAEWEMFPVLRSALFKLRVNLEAMDDDDNWEFTPRRPPRNAVLPPRDHA